MIPTSWLFVAAACAAIAASAQAPVVRDDGEIAGRTGWTLDNGRIRVTLLRGGGHIGEVRLLSDDATLAINPLYVPAGGGYVGHLVCFPHFGPASPEERKAGLSGHGEAGSVDWEQTQAPQTNATGVTFFYGATLPKTNYRIERAVSMKPGEAAVHVEESIENLAAYDRPYNWNQHATFGAPFVAPGRTVLDMSARRGMTDPKRTARDQWAAAREFTWPDAPTAAGGTISLREFRAVPGGQAYTAVLTSRPDPHGWFAMFNADFRLLVGYIFPAADHPWIVDWQNQPRTETTAGTARGIEFGTSPWDEGLRRSVDRAQMFGTPTFRWIAARQRVSTTFTIVLQEIPPTFAGVADVTIDGGRVRIHEKTPAYPSALPVK